MAKKIPAGLLPTGCQKNRGQQISEKTDMLYRNLFLHMAIVRNLCKWYVQGRSSDSGIFTAAGLPGFIQWHIHLQLLPHSGATV